MRDVNPALWTACGAERSSMRNLAESGQGRLRGQLAGRTWLVARLAITKSFLDEYARLDRDVQSAVDAAVSKFAKHPDPGLYLEKPLYGWDDRIRIFEVDGFAAGQGADICH